MSQIAENIKKLMAIEGINAAELSAKTGIERSTLHRILDGSTKNPTIESIKSIIKHYSFEKVVFGPSHSNSDEIPIINWEEANFFELDKVSSKNIKKIKRTSDTSLSAFALIVNEPLDLRFQKGTIIVIDPKKAPKNRSFVLVQEKNANFPIIKRYLIEGNTEYLKPLDNSLPSTHYNKNIFKILGVIVQSIFDFD